ncbi:hypothetical protein GCM10010415_30480 [Streptomyces atrovirens]
MATDMAIELAVKAKREVPDCFVSFGGHSVSFVAEDVLEQAAGAVVRGEGEPAIAPLPEAVRDGGVDGVPGIVTTAGRSPAPLMMHGVDGPLPARDLMRVVAASLIGTTIEWYDNSSDQSCDLRVCRVCPFEVSTEPAPNQHRRFSCRVRERESTPRPARNSATDPEAGHSP